ncbi:unnamed protein product [Schistocephalus solidus]|uniref:Muscular LMNA-interacting protein n=1 Tax=Schistocephalus solidus TaxID=70667 RepID=A0A183TIA0_SCHSO|nr:unnamed protein product [Schistocephalus solidus]
MSPSLLRFPMEHTVDIVGLRRSNCRVCVWWYAQGQLRPRQPPALSSASGLLDSVMPPGSGGGGGVRATFPPVDPALATLPPKLSLLPDIVMHIQELKSSGEALDLTSTEPPPGLSYEARLCESTVYEQVNPATRIYQGRVSMAYTEYPAAPVPPRKQQLQPVAPRTAVATSQHSATLPRFFLSTGEEEEEDDEEKEKEEEENIVTVSWAGSHALDRSAHLEPRLPLGTEYHPERAPYEAPITTKSTPLRSNKLTVRERRTTIPFSESCGGQASGEHPEQRSPERKQLDTTAISVGTQPVVCSSRGLPSQPRTSETTTTPTTIRDTDRITTQEREQQMSPIDCSGAAVVRPEATLTRTAIFSHPREDDLEGDYDDPYSEEHEPSQATHLNGTPADDRFSGSLASITVPKSDAVLLAGPYSGILRSLDSSLVASFDAAKRTLSFPSPPSAFSLYRRPKPTFPGSAMTPTESTGIYKFFRLPAMHREIPEEDLHSGALDAPRDLETRLETRSIMAASRISATHSAVATSGNRELDERVNSATATTFSTPRTSFPTTSRSLDVLMVKQSSNSAVASNPCTGNGGTAEVRQYPSRFSTTTSSSSGRSSIAFGKQNVSPETSELSRSTLAHHYPYRQAVNAAISAAAFASTSTSSSSSSSTDNQVFESSYVPQRCSRQYEPAAAPALATGGRDSQTTPDRRRNQITVMSTLSEYQPACSAGQRGDHSQARTIVETLVTLTSGHPQRRPQQLTAAPTAPCRALQEETETTTATGAASILSSGAKATTAADNSEAKVRRVGLSRLGSAGTATSGRTSAAAAVATGSTNKPADRQKPPRTVADRIQPLVENEKMLSSTLEELGDAVAWLERERNDLLQQERLSRTPSSSSCHRQQSNHGGATNLRNTRSYGSPSKHKTLGANTSVLSLNFGYQAAEEPIFPRPQAPYTYQKNYSADGMPGALTKSTNSLSSADPMLSPNTPAATLVGNYRTSYLFSRSGSGSASPHRSRHSSGSSDRSFLTARSSLVSRGSVRGESSRSRAGGGGFSSQVTPKTTSVPRPSGLMIKGGRIESMEALYNCGGSPHRLQPRNASASRSNCSLYSDRPPNLFPCSLGRPSSDALSPGVLNRETHNFAVPSSPLTS